MPHNFWQGGQNCIQLVQSRVFLPFLENQKRYLVGSLLPNAFGRVVKTPFYVCRAKFWQKQFFWEKIFCLFSKFSSEFIQILNDCRVISKKFRISRQNCTLALQIFVLGGTRFAGGSKFLKLLGVELKKTEYLCACFSIAFSKTPYTSPEDQFGREHVKKNFLVERKKDRRNAFGCLLKTTQNVYQTTTDILFRRFFGRRCGWRVS